MAPGLLGYHKRVVCPTCKFPFTFGIAFDKPDPESLLVKCPNCGRDQIEIGKVPRNQGDQLLVMKNAFAFLLPKRWEVVVFRNPNNPTQAYVKRIVGTPGDSIQIRDGDVWIDGNLQRKSLEQQRTVRLPVYDRSFRPKNDPTWKDRWLHDDDWEVTGGTFTCRQPRGIEATRKEANSWVSYRHWIRSGGEHETSVALRTWPVGVQIPNPVFSPLRYNSRSGSIVCRGVMSDDLRDKMLKQSKDEKFQDAIWKLYRQSHLSPILDTYGYNRSSVLSEHVAVRDLMVSMRVTVNSGRGLFTVRMTDGESVFDCVMDFGARRLRVYRDIENSEPIVEFALSKVNLGQEFLFEMSLFDRQLLAAIDGEPLVIEPMDEAARLPRSRNYPRQPLGFASRGLDVEVAQLQLFRDVHDTTGSARHGVAEPFHLGKNEYFCLGDNSPVSLDSRGWETAAVKRHMLLGKPVLVHLPSKPGKIQIGNYVGYFRIPDFSRIRYIR
ncbi:MAG: signal peptidase I [Planctomycetaceae bacterium]|nr:signal peptidase I [Planctomycetaceae bacterium]